MKKLSLLLTLLSLWACRSPQEATQTVIKINADDVMRGRIKSYKTQVISLPQDEVVFEENEEEARWPVKRTFTPKHESSSHRFRFVLTALGEAGLPVTTLDIETEVVQGASRYLYFLLNDDCLNCIDGVCKTMLEAAALRTSPAQAQQLEAGCRDGKIDSPRVPTAPAEPDETMSQNTGDVAGRDAVPSTGTMTGSVSTAPPAANGGSTAKPAPDASVPTAPPSTDAQCASAPCGPGDCSLNSALPLGYECACHSGFERDETGSTCVKRNDCNKPDKGGCEDLCEPNEIGEAVCSCEGPNRWLKADRKQCTALQKQLKLSTSAGSVERTRPQVAFDREGNGVVVWAETTAENAHSLWTARYSAVTRNWDIPSRGFIQGTTLAADLHLALDASGSGLLIWTAAVASKRQLWAIRYRDGAFDLLTAHRIDADGLGEALMPSLALDAMGDGLVVWSDVVYPKSTLRVSRYLSSTDEFLNLQNIVDPGDRFVFGTSVAVNSLMSGLVAWTNVPVNTAPEAGPVPDFLGTSALSSRVDTRLAGVIDFGVPSARSTSPDVVLDAQGNGIAVWVQGSGSTTSPLSVVSRSYVPGVGWRLSLPPHTLSERGGVFSLPRVVMGSDGSAFATWREIWGLSATAAEPSSTRSQTYGALRTADGFEASYELGRPSDTAAWNDIDTTALTPETALALLDQLQPSWSTAVGPDQAGFIAGASFTSTPTAAMRELWLQRIGTQDAPGEPISLSAPDAVPGRPSPVRLSLNANGDGAVVWDHQVEGRYHVFVNLLD